MNQYLDVYTSFLEHFHKLVLIMHHSRVNTNRPTNHNTSGWINDEFVERYCYCKLGIILAIWWSD